MTKTEILNDFKSKSIIYNKIKSFYYQRFFTDESLIKKKYYKVFGKELDLENPQTFNEKLQWLKLNWYDELAVIGSDKYEARQFVEKEIGSELLNELYAVYDTVEEINFDELPNSFVLKATHGSGWNIICKNKDEMDWKSEKKKMKMWLSNSYFWGNREWVYKEIKPRIICEKYIDSKDSDSLKDYKIFCFDGEPKFMFLVNDRGSSTKFDFYDIAWNKIPVSQHYPNSNYNNQMPKEWEEMLNYAKVLSKKFPHVRVDFYLEDGKIIFGELTFFHFGGYKVFDPSEYDLIFGEMLTLPNSNRNKK